MVSAAPLSDKHTPDSHFRTIQYPQTSTRQTKTNLYPVFSSLRSMANRRTALRVSFPFFQKVILLKDRSTKRLLRLKTWVIFGSREQWTGFLRLWSFVFVYKCSCLIYLFHLYRLLVQCFAIFWEFTFFVCTVRVTWPRRKLPSTTTM